jgi:polyisoprenoid-binding protein YceI
MDPHRRLRRTAVATVIALALSGGVSAAQSVPLAMDTARVTISGTSNVHSWRAWTDTVRLTRVKLAAPIAGGSFWDDVLKPGVIQGFDIAIPVATLTSRDEGLDKNLYQALKLEANRDITFRLKMLEVGPGGPLMAVGVVRIAGVEREVVLPIEARRSDERLVVSGRLPLLMTDFGIAPPTAMLGMLKTDAKVTVAFEVVLSVPGT